MLPWARSQTAHPPHSLAGLPPLAAERQRRCHRSDPGGIWIIRATARWSPPPGPWPRPGVANEDRRLSRTKEHEEVHRRDDGNSVPDSPPRRSLLVKAATSGNSIQRLTPNSGDTTPNQPRVCASILASAVAARATPAARARPRPPSPAGRPRCSRRRGASRPPPTRQRGSDSAWPAEARIGRGRRHSLGTQTKPDTSPVVPMGRTRRRVVACGVVRRPPGASPHPDPGRPGR